MKEVYTVYLTVPYLEKQDIRHIRTRAYHPMTQGKIERYHEAIDNVTPADKYYGRDLDVLKNREKVRKQTMKLRRKLNRMAGLQSLPNGVS